MKENKYDNPAFFEQYSKMDRSVKGLQGAGEWHELKKLLPPLYGKRVLDIGCGFGWHCRYAVEQGAVEVVGTDISQKMLERARELTTQPAISYRQISMEEMSFAPGSFDLALSSLAFHYVADFPAICEKVRSWLTPGGSFVFSVEHPVFTAQGSQNWHIGQDGAPQHWPVDRYFDEGKRTAVFLGEEVVKYHKTLTTYINTLLAGGFRLTGLVEPQPAPELLETVPGMEQELRRPMMLLLAAVKE